MACSFLVNALARSLLSGEPTVEATRARAARTLGHPWRWLGPLARRYTAAFAGQTRPSHREVVYFLSRDTGFRRACAKHSDRLSVEQWLTEPQRMQPVLTAATWQLPPIESAGALAQWLSVSVGELDWFADLKGLADRERVSTLAHYHYRILAKQFGSIRLIEAPKPRLKELQRRILTEILDKIPPHPAAHGFVKARSIKTFVAPHVNRPVVLRMDLQDFFPSISAARIDACFRTMGYPDSIARLLTGMCTNAAPRGLWTRPAWDVNPRDLQEARLLYCRPHLPQGAPTSPSLANFCAYRADCRLKGLAASVGAEYTRYADDLAFSGGDTFDRSVERFSISAAAILLEEGFAVHHRKTRIMRQAVRQHLAGLVTNDRINIMRLDFDRLKAILTNCVRQAPETQNRENHPAFRSHLEGRVAFVEGINSTKGQRLRAIFDKIRWE